MNDNELPMALEDVRDGLLRYYYSAEQSPGVIAEWFKYAADAVDAAIRQREGE